MRNSFVTAATPIAIAFFCHFTCIFRPPSNHLLGTNGTMDESPTRSANSRRRQSIGRGQAPLSFDLRGEGDQDDRVGDVQRITDAWDMGVHDFSATKVSSAELRMD